MLAAATVEIYGNIIDAADRNRNSGGCVVWYFIRQYWFSFLAGGASLQLSLSPACLEYPQLKYNRGVIRENHSGWPSPLLKATR